MILKCSLFSALACFGLSLFVLATIAGVKVV